MGVPFHTSPLPPGVPSFDVAGSDPTGSYTLVSSVVSDPLPDEPQYLAAVDSTGQAVWYLTTPTGVPAVGDLQKQPNGSYTLALYDHLQAVPGLPGGSAAFAQYDNLGEVTHVWQAPVGDGGFLGAVMATDGYEIRLVDDGGAALLFAIDPIPYDFNTIAHAAGAPGGCWPDGGHMDKDGGPCYDFEGTVFDYVLEKVSQDGGVLWSWDVGAHIPPTQVDPGAALGTLGPCNTKGHPFADGGGSCVHTFEAYRPVAVDVLTDGTYLITLRQQSALVDVEPDGGSIAWRLGGVANDLTFAGDAVKPSPGPSLPHHGRQRVAPDGGLLISMFDDGDFHNPPQSRGVEYALDLTKKTATLVWEQYGQPQGFDDVFGSVQFLDNGNALIDFGSSFPPLSKPVARVQEFASDGGLVWSLVDDQVRRLADGGAASFADGGAIPEDVGIYRALRIDSVY
jgi:hypothetical protein